MQFEVTHGPAYAMVTANLDAGETVVAEAGAMISMDSHVNMETKAAKKKDEGLLGGLMSGLKRMVAGESFFQNHFTANGSAGKVVFAPTLVGDIKTYELDGSKNLIMQSSAYICSSDGVDVDAKWGGGSSFFGGEGLIMLKCSGTGPIAFNSFGGIKKIEVDGKFVVDTGHIVAFEDSLSFKVGKFGGGWKSFILGGEGLVCNFSGTGTLYIQTRTPQGFGELVGPLLPMR